jgi:hypothetical protein
MAQSASPAEWYRILDEIDRYLTHALQTTAVDLEAPADAPDLGPARLQEFDALCARLQGLQASVEKAEVLMRPADLALEFAEVALQTQINASAAMRPRLAEWTGRAIG